MKTCSFFIMIIVGVIIGLSAGLLIGWVIWPVEWTDASPENLRFSWQVDWINMAVDSYSVNGNEDLAIQRYNDLGASGPAALAAVSIQPKWVTDSDVQAFASVVKGSGLESAVTPSSEQVLDSLTSRLLKPPLIGYLAVALFLALLALVLLIVLIMRLLSPKNKAPSGEGTTEPVMSVAETGGSDAEVSQPIDEAVAEPQEVVEGGIGEGVTIAEEVSSEELVETSEIEILSEETVSQDEDQGLRLAGIAGLGTAAVVAAEVISNEKEEATIDEQEESLAEVSETLEEPTEVRNEGIAGIAAAAGVEWALEDEAAPQESILAPEEAGVPEIKEVEEGVKEWLPEGEQEAESPEFYGKYNRKIIDIEGIGDVYAEKLADVGITTTHAYLQQTATRKGRTELADKTGIPSKLILEWANHADMMRISGIGPQWSDLLEMAGVNTVRELASRNPSNLLEAITKVNDEKKLVRQLPTLEMLEDWVEQAQELPKILTY